MRRAAGSSLPFPPQAQLLSPKPKSPYAWTQAYPTTQPSPSTSHRNRLGALEPEVLAALLRLTGGGEGLRRLLEVAEDAAVRVAGKPRRRVELSLCFNVVCSAAGLPL